MTLIEAPTNKPYLLDDQPVNARELIKFAKTNYGYGENEFVLRTSAAADVLRKNGHRVEENLQPTETK